MAVLLPMKPSTNLAGVLPKRAFAAKASLLALCPFLLIRCAVIAAETNATPPAEYSPAKLKISGYGVLGNRQLKRTLNRLEFAGKKPEFLDATFIEDAALILVSQVRRDGFLAASVGLQAILTNGAVIRASGADILNKPLPRPLFARSVEYQIRKGPLFYYETLDLKGLESMSPEQARAYFVQTGTILHLKGSRIFTPERLRRSLRNLSEAFDRQGYRDVQLSVRTNQFDRASGAVSITIDVQQGMKYIVRSVREEYDSPGQVEAGQLRTLYPHKPWSSLWAQEFSQSLKTNLYVRGFPDVQVALEAERQEPVPPGTVNVDLLARIHTGHQVRIGNIIIRGNKHTRSGFISRRIRVERGELLNPIRLERARARLAELGAFNSVDLSYDPPEADTRDVIFRVREAKRLNLSLLFGWGSYEMLRGGVEAEYNNIWGLAHFARLKAIQSFKATSGEFTYTIPDFSLTHADLFVNGFGLRRDEVSFTREEYGGGIGAHRFFRKYATDVTLRYNYQVLNALSIVPQVASEGLTNPAVGSVIADIRYDRRDNPLYPTKGFKLFLTSETSDSEFMGGDANYERIELSTAFHVRIGGGRNINLGLSHGIAASFGDAASNLPFNKRFFPGGANSIRGYQDGEASPRNQQGQIVGAESYLLGNIELEQALTPKWSLVAFADGLGIARRFQNYPFDESLFSVGGGIRWRTIIGPVRLEYGHNLNPRPRDPAGTLHFSLGFPF